MEEISGQLDKFKSKIHDKNKLKCTQISHWINDQIDLDKNSIYNNIKKNQDPNKYHPIRPTRGEIYMVEMGSNVGFEFNEYHPALIIQNDTGNAYRDTTIIIPITELKATERFDNNIHIKITNYHLEKKDNGGLDKDPSKLKVCDIRAIDKARLKTRVGKVTDTFMEKVENKLKQLLSFS